LPEEFELELPDEFELEFEDEFELLFDDEFELELLFEFELLFELELLDEFELLFEFEFDPPCGGLHPPPRVERFLNFTSSGPSSLWPAMSKGSAFAFSVPMPACAPNGRSAASVAGMRAFGIRISVSLVG
jgi:hypothetical protein